MIQPDIEFIESRWAVQIAGPEPVTLDITARKELLTNGECLFVVTAAGHRETGQGLYPRDAIMELVAKLYPEPITTN